MTDASRISDAEWLVMQIAWNRGCVSAADVITELQERTGWNHRTIRTMLKRLADKGLLEAEPDGKRHLYRPCVSRDTCIRQESRTFLDRVFCGDTESLLMHFVQDGNVSPESLAEIRRVLDEADDEQNQKPRGSKS